MSRSLRFLPFARFAQMMRDTQANDMTIGAMGLGPVPAVEEPMQRTGLAIADFDVIDSNVSFAALACAVNKGHALAIERY